LFFLLSCFALSVPQTKATLAPTGVLQNTVLIDNGFLADTSLGTNWDTDFLLSTTPTTASDIATELAAAHVDTVAFGTFQLYPDGSIVTYESDSNFVAFNAAFHAVGITTLLWIENQGSYCDLANSTITTALASSLRTKVTTCNFDGVFFDDEGPTQIGGGSFSVQSASEIAYTNWVNTQTIIYHGIGKYFTISLGGDSDNSLTPFLHVDMIYNQFYSGSHSYFLDPQGAAYWQLDLACGFYDYQTGTYPILPPASPINMLVYNYRTLNEAYNATDWPLTNQLNQAVIYNNAFGTGYGSVGFGFWILEYFQNNDLSTIGNFVSSYYTTTSPTPAPTASPSPSPAPIIPAVFGLNEIVLFAALFGFLSLAFYTVEPFLFMVAGFLAVIGGIDLEFLYSGNLGVWSFEFIGLIAMGFGVWVVASGVNVQLQLRKNSSYESKLLKKNTNIAIVFAFIALLVILCI
jgi:hypothetical protein